jgi:hypothetical protein
MASNLPAHPVVLPQHCAAEKSRPTVRFTQGQKMLSYPQVVGLAHLAPWRSLCAQPYISVIWKARQPD